jgi:hypothetical protein
MGMIGVAQRLGTIRVVLFILPAEEGEEILYDGVGVGVLVYCCCCLMRFVFLSSGLCS